MAELQDYRWLSRGEDASLISHTPSPVPVGSELSQSHPSKSSVRFEVDVVEEDVDAGPHGEGEGEGEGATLNESSVAMGDHTFGYRTMDAAPITDHYRETQEMEGERRPTLMDLIAGGRGLPKDASVLSMAEVEQADGEGVERRGWWGRWRRKKTGPKKPRKFGWIIGVLIRCMLNIWGVMLFLRLSWVTGQGGIGLAALIVLLSMIVTILTTLSMSAITTNGQIKGGGAYYLISRNLGPEFGGAIGIIFALANAVAVALYVVGFSETVHDLIHENGAVFTGSVDNDVRVIGLGVVTILLVIVLIGLDWEAVIQFVLLIVMLFSIGDFYLGVLLPPEAHIDIFQYSSFTWFNGDTIVDNFKPRFSGEAAAGSEIESFFILFGIFFPAATGILAGANISGDLKDPQKAIPRGTLLAIIITGITYLSFAILVGMVVLKESTPFIPDCVNNTYPQLVFPDATTLGYCNETYGLFNPWDRSRVGNSLGSLTALFRSTCPTLAQSNVTGSDGDLFSCTFGLLNDYQVVSKISVVPYIVTVGIFAATLSSALTSLVSAPKVFQRVCQDKLFPFIHFFAKGGGRSGTEPIRGYLLTFVIAVIFILIGQLNTIAPIISNFFLSAYTLINYSCFASSFTKTPGWRPAFKFYNKWVSLFAAVLCLVIMFIISWYTALITITLVLGLYLYIWYKKPDVNWGSYGQAFWFMQAMLGLKKLELTASHIKNYRPHFLLLSGRPSSRPDLVKFSAQLNGGNGIVVCGDVMKPEVSVAQQQAIQEAQTRWLRQNKIRLFYNSVLSSSLRDGCRVLYQTAGLGKLRPNVVLMGFKNNWRHSMVGEVEEYINVLRDAFAYNMGVGVFRLRAGFDATEKSEGTAVGGAGHSTMTYTPRASADMGNPQSNSRLSFRSASTHEYQPLLGGAVGEGEKVAPGRVEVHTDMDLSTFHRSSSAMVGSNEVTRTSVRSYTAAIEAGEMEFADDDPPPAEGVESRDSAYEVVTMPSRFAQSQGKGFVDVYWLYDDGGLSLLLPHLLAQDSKWKNCKLRIFTASSPQQIDSAALRMTTLLHRFRIEHEIVQELTNLGKPSPESVERYKETYRNVLMGSFDTKLDPKTLRHIRLGEILREKSTEAKLIVVTISVPLKEGCTAHQYMSWLDVLSDSLPPILLMRGNQQSVLTFDS